MISLKNLILITPFQEETKQKLLIAQNEMNDDQKYRLSETCWATLSTIYQNRSQRVVDEMMREMAEGKKQYSQNDFEEAKTKLVFEFTRSLESVQTESEIMEVKKQLEQHLKSVPLSPQK